MNMQFCAPTGYGSPYGFPQGQSTMAYPDQYAMHQTYSSIPYMYNYEQNRPPMMGAGKTESKPRLSKDEVEKLEKVFQENPKPSSSMKGQLADSLGLERPRINNWFQNRRAKAKQERKQEEYEARRAAEKSTSEASSPDQDSFSGTLNSLSEGSLKRTQPSSAAFPSVSSPSQITDVSREDEDEEGDDEVDEDMEEDEDIEVADSSSACMPSSNLAQAEHSDAYHSSLSMGFSQSDVTTFTHAHNSGGYIQSRSGSDLGLYGNSVIDGHPRRTERSLSSEGHPSQQQYVGMHSRSMFFPSVSSSDACDMSDHSFDNTSSPDSQGMPTPTADSFRSPPPPANIATRRNMARPATLQAASLRSRSYNVPKTAIDGSKRMDISSPVSSIRRISSVSGLNVGRIQKSSAGPRSPFFGRAEAFMQQYHARSPIGSATPTFPGAAPATPMTPALFDQQHGREPAVMSASPEDTSFVLGMGVAPNFVQEIKEEQELKTPPTTPGMMAGFGTTGFVANNYGSGFNMTADQPLMTPYFQSEFPTLSIQHVPSYVETSDNSPSTPVYGGMMSSGLEHSSYTGNVMANTQYDWEANESVVSSRSSPGYTRSKQIQFTPNMTPQDYH